MGCEAQASLATLCSGPGDWVYWNAGQGTGVWCSGDPQKAQHSRGKDSTLPPPSIPPSTRSQTQAVLRGEFMILFPSVFHHVQ